LLYNDVRQDRCARGALLDGLRRFAGCLHRAGARIGETVILDHFHLRRKIFAVLADFFPNLAQGLMALGAVLFCVRQIVLDPLTLQMFGQRLPSAGSARP